MSKLKQNNATGASKNASNNGDTMPKNEALETANVNTGSAVEPLYAVDLIDWKVGGYTKESLLQACTGTIETVLIKQEGLASKLAQTLYIVDKEELYKTAGNTSTAKWAEEHFGMKKSTVSEAIKVYSRFGTRRGIADKYSKYNFSSLIKMASLSDDELKFIGVNPSMSRAQIVAKIKDYKELQQELPKLSDNDRSAVEQAKTLEDAEKEYNKIEERENEKARAKNQPNSEGVQEVKEAQEEFTDKVGQAMDDAIAKKKEEKEADSLGDAMIKIGQLAGKLDGVYNRLTAVEKLIEEKCPYEVLAVEIKAIKEIMDKVE